MRLRTAMQPRNCSASTVAAIKDGTTFHSATGHIREALDRAKDAAGDLESD